MRTTERKAKSIHYSVNTTMKTFEVTTKFNNGDEHSYLGGVSNVRYDRLAESDEQLLSIAKEMAFSEASNHGLNAKSVKHVRINSRTHPVGQSDQQTQGE